MSKPIHPKFPIASLVNPNSPAARAAAHIREAIVDRKKPVLIRGKALRRIFTSKQAERQIADRFGLPSDQELWEYTLKLHSLAAVYLPAVDAYRIELIKTKKPRKQRTRRPVAKCPQCGQDCYCLEVNAGEKHLDYHTNRSTKERCCGSYTTVARDKAA